MPYLTLPQSRRRRDRLIAHPELILGPGWAWIGTVGVWASWTGPLTGWLLAVALITTACVTIGGLHLTLSVLLTPRMDADDGTGLVPLSRIWALERFGWIVGGTGWAAYGLVIGYGSRNVPALALAMAAVAVLRLIALGQLESHVRAATPEKGGDTDA